MNVILDNLTLFCYILEHVVPLAVDGFSETHAVTVRHWSCVCRVSFAYRISQRGSSRVGPLLFSEVQGATAFFSWTLVLVYLITECHAHTCAGVLLDPDSILALLLGLAIPPESAYFLPPLTSFWLITHVVLAFLGNAAFALTFCGGIMYLIQDSYFKAKQPGGFSARLPSLEMLDRLNFWALAFGLPLLTQGIITGAIWARYARGSFWIWERTTWPLIVMWGIYTLLFIGRWYLGWRGRAGVVRSDRGILCGELQILIHTLG